MVNHFHAAEHNKSTAKANKNTGKAAKELEEKSGGDFTVEEKPVKEIKGEFSAKDKKALDAMKKKKKELGL